MMDGDQGGRSAQVQRGAGAKQASYRATTDPGLVGGAGGYDVMSEDEQLQLKESPGLKGKRTRVEGR